MIKERGIITLSKRLGMAAALVTHGNSVADVGCDHAYTSIYLLEAGISPRCIAMDVRQGPLERANINIRAHCLEGRIETRLSDGLASMLPGETATVLITGMGGQLICDILSAFPDKTRAARELVLSPQSEVGKVRTFLYENGFDIVKEAMCFDAGKYYIAMKAVPCGTHKRPFPKDPELSDFLREKGDPTYVSWLEKELKLRETILNAGNEESGENGVLPERRRAELLDDIRRFKNEINDTRTGIRI